MKSTDTQRAKFAEYYAAHRATMLAKAKAYYAANREAVLAQKKSRYIKHPRILRERSVSWYWKNRDKVRAYRKTEHYKALAKKYTNPIKARKSWLKNRYGITPELYEEILSKQGGVCAICKGTNTHNTRWGTKSVILTVDHCHKSGRVRGLLCHKCNAGLGYFRDNVDIVKSAIEYLSS